MFSITLKRSIATLGVVAGLLAAAVPASAAPTEELFGNYNFAAEAEGTQVGGEGVKAPTKAGPQPEVNGYLATDPSSEVDNQVMIIDGNNLDRVFQIRGDAQDTQTSRASSLKDTLVSGYNVNPLETVSFAIKGAAFRGEVTGLEPH
jgi:hypothetical protein